MVLVGIGWCWWILDGVGGYWRVLDGVGESLQVSTERLAPRIQVTSYEIDNIRKPTLFLNNLFVPSFNHDRRGSHPYISISISILHTITRTHH